MTKKIDEKQLYLNAQQKVRRLRIFYLHLMLFIIGVSLILYNFFIMEGPYTQVITGLNISVLVFWTVVIIIHAWSVFKGRLMFKKSWEDKKVEEILRKEKEEETRRWE